MGEKRRTVTGLHVFTQSYDSVNLRYTETFSLQSLPLFGRKAVLRNLTIQNYFFGADVPPEFPVTLAFLVGDTDYGGEIAQRAAGAPLGITIQTQPRESNWYTYGIGTEDLFLVAAAEVDPYRPHRFAFYDAEQALHPDFSASGLMRSIPDAYLTGYLLHGSYSAPGEIVIESAANKGLLSLLPYVDGLQFTELACVSRVNFEIQEWD